MTALLVVLVIVGGLLLGYGWAALELLVSSRAGWLVVVAVVAGGLFLIGTQDPAR